MSRSGDSENHALIDRGLEGLILTVRAVIRIA
jgi:hypothetical protein